MFHKIKTRQNTTAVYTQLNLIQKQIILF